MGRTVIIFTWHYRKTSHLFAHLPPLYHLEPPACRREAQAFFFLQAYGAHALQAVNLFAITTFDGLYLDI